MHAVPMAGGRVLRLGRLTYTTPSDGAPVERSYFAASSESDPRVPLGPGVVLLPLVEAVFAVVARLEVGE